LNQTIQKCDTCKAELNGSSAAVSADVDRGEDGYVTLKLRKGKDPGATYHFDGRECIVRFFNDEILDKLK